VRDERLSNVVTNPLLATIAATVFTRQPAHPLHSNRIGLYRKFVSYLYRSSGTGRLRCGSASGS
jgi:hypothetical protein